MASEYRLSYTAEDINRRLGKIDNLAEKSDIVQADWSQNDDTALDYIKNRTHWVEDDGVTYHPLDEKFIPETVATKEYVEALYKKLNSNTVLGFYCIEDVTIVTNGISKTYPANSNVEVTFIEGDEFEIVPTSDNSIMALTAFPSALGTYYPWLEGVKQFSNILFDMNDVDMYSKWSQGNQGAYNVQYAQYANCIFWSDNSYVSDVSKRTNYTLYYTSQLPLCFSTIPDNTFKAFFLAFGVNSDPNWGNKVYRDSFAKATWATQAFSYYGARTIGIFGHDDPDFNITLPKDCRGLMYASTAIENAGTFDAINTTDFGAKSGSWRDAFGWCSSLRNLYIKNLKVNLNVSWSPLNYDSISFIISEAANTNKITISVSPYTYNLLGASDFDLAASKNITIALLTGNYVEDRRLGEIANKADKTYVDNQIAGLINSAPETLDTLGELATAFGENKDVVDALNESIVNKQNKNIIVYRDAETGKANMTAPEIMEKVRVGENVYYTVNLSGGTLHPYLEGADTGVFFYSNYIDNDRVIGTGILISADGTITTETYELEHLKDTIMHITSAERNKWNDTYSKTETDNLLNAKANVENPVFSGTMGLNHAGELGFTAVSLGFANEASGMYSFSEGMGNKSTGDASHSEGTANTASGYASHAEGYGVLASETGAHAEGAYTVASGYGSHAEGSYTIASVEGQHVEGKYNIEDATSAHIIGNGTSNTKRSNAHTIGFNGEAWFAGDVYVGSTSGTNRDDGSKKLATEEYVDEKIASTSTGSSVQSDWNQNDESADDYIKNRPFYDDMEVLFDTVTVNNGDTLDMHIDDDDYGKEGDSLVVIWDGVPSNKVIGYCDLIVGNWIVPRYTLGNQALMNDSDNTFEDTGEEYLIESIENNLGSSTIYCDDNPHTLSIAKCNIVKIDEKFIPDTIARVADVDEKIDEAISNIPSVANAEAKMPIELGAFQYFKWENLTGTLEEKAQQLARYGVIVYQGELSGNLNMSGTAYQNQLELYTKALEYNPDLKVFGYVTARGFAYKSDGSGTIGMEEYRTSPANADHPIWTKEELAAYINLMAHCGGTKDASATDEFGNPVLTGGIPLYGVFFDDWDYNFEYQNTHLQHQGDWNSIREKHNFLIDYAHSCGLHVMPNSNPNLIFDNTATPSNYRNPDGIESHMNENDWFCAESYFLRSDDTFGINDGYLTDYNERYRDTYKSKCLALTYVHAVSDDAEDNEQIASTFAVYQALCQGISAIALHGTTLFTELPAELSKYYDKNNNAIYSSGDGFYRLTVNGHTVTASRSVGGTAYGMTPDSNALSTCLVTIDGQHTFNNMYVRSEELAYSYADFKSDVESKVEELSSKVEQSSNLYHRAFIDDWGKNYTLADYTNHCFTFQNAFGGEDTGATSSWISLYPYDFTVKLPAQWSWRRVLMDATHLAGKTVELGFESSDAYLSSNTATKVNPIWQVVAVSDAGETTLATFGAQSTSKSEIDGVQRCCVKFTMPENITQLMFWTQRTDATPSGTWVIKASGSYLVDLNEYERRKTWFTNYAPSMSQWGAMGNWSNYEIIRDGDSVATKYTATSNCYESGVTFPANPNIFKAGETWEIGFKGISMKRGVAADVTNKIVIMMNIGTNICPNVYIYGKTSADFKNMKSATGSDDLIAITRFTIPSTYSGGMPETPIYVYPENYAGGDANGLYTLYVEGLYMYKIDEKEELSIRGEEPSDTYIGINRVRTDTIDEKLSPDTLYIVDDGSMFITDFRGDRIDIAAGGGSSSNTVTVDEMNAAIEAAIGAAIGGAY